MMYVQWTVVRIITLHIDSRVHFKPQNAYPIPSSSHYLCIIWLLVWYRMAWEQARLGGTLHTYLRSDLTTHHRPVQGYIVGDLLAHQKLVVVYSPQILVSESLTRQTRIEKCNKINITQNRWNNHEWCSWIAMRIITVIIRGMVTIRYRMIELQRNLESWKLKWECNKPISSQSNERVLWLA